VASKFMASLWRTASSCRMCGGGGVLGAVPVMITGSGVAGTIDGCGSLEQAYVVGLDRGIFRETTPGRDGSVALLYWVIVEDVVDGGRSM
jgi:hypothetical protein